jgi:serine protease
MRPWLPRPRLASPRLALSRRGAALAALLALGLLSSGVLAQDALHYRFTSDALALPAIDLGFRTLPAEDYATPIRSRANSSDGMAYAPGRVIVKFRDGTSQASRSFSARSVSATASTTPAYANFEVLQIDAAADPESVARDLSARADVEYAQPDYRVYPRFTPNDPNYSRQWNFPALNMEAAWDINPGASSSIIVAVLDTGVAYKSTNTTFFASAIRGDIYTYPALGSVSVPFAAAPDLVSTDRIVTPYDFVWNDSEPLDLDGHGTHVSGTIGQLTNNNVGGAGMAFNVRLMPIKVLSTDWDEIFGAPFNGTDSVVARGIRYAVDNGARVLNMSLGRSGASAPVLEDALKYAVSKGAFVAIAAGNEYEDGNPDEEPAGLGATIEGVMTVGAVGRDLNRAYYSAVKSYVEIAAPGGNFRANGNDGLIYQQSFDPGLSLSSPLGSNVRPSQYRAPRFDALAFVGEQGTSMATPHVAGLAALLMQQGITNPAAIEAAIKRFATDRGGSGRDDEYGSGLINPRATLRGLGLAK